MGLKHGCIYLSIPSWGTRLAIGLVYGFRQQYFDTKGSGLRNLIIVFAGLFFFASVQGYLQYAPMTEQERYVVMDEAGQPKAKENIQASDYPAPKFRAEKSPEEITKIQNTAEQILHPKEDRGKLGTNLDYGIMIGYFLSMILIGTWLGEVRAVQKISSLVVSDSLGGSLHFHLLRQRLVPHPL